MIHWLTVGCCIYLTIRQNCCTGVELVSGWRQRSPQPRWGSCDLLCCNFCSIRQSLRFECSFAPLLATVNDDGCHGANNLLLCRMNSVDWVIDVRGLWFHRPPDASWITQRHPLLYSLCICLYFSIYVITFLTHIVIRKHIFYNQINYWFWSCMVFFVFGSRFF